MLIPKAGNLVRRYDVLVAVDVWAVGRTVGWIHLGLLLALALEQVDYLGGAAWGGAGKAGEGGRGSAVDSS